MTTSRLRNDSNMIRMTPQFKTFLFFSYGQFMISDESCDEFVEWSAPELRQGFARGEQVVNVSTRLQYGRAILSIYSERYTADERHERVIEVPFVVSGEGVEIHGPEELPGGRVVRVPCGHYRLTVAQFATGEEDAVIDLFFEPVGEPLAHSGLVLVDRGLDPRKV